MKTTWWDWLILSVMVAGLVLAWQRASADRPVQALIVGAGVLALDRMSRQK